MSPSLLYLTFVVGGVILEALSVKIYLFLTKSHLRKNHFILGRYLFLLLFPLLSTYLVINMHGWPLFKIFIIFFFLGPILEWCVGYAYYQIVGTRLWTYHKYTYLGHTSLLSAPFWGMAGVLFYLLAQKLI